VRAILILTHALVSCEVNMPRNAHETGAVILHLYIVARVICRLTAKRELTEKINFRFHGIKEEDPIL
jgi:hypothetical protein